MRPDSLDQRRSRAGVQGLAPGVGVRGRAPAAHDEPPPARSEASAGGGPRRVDLLVSCANPNAQLTDVRARLESLAKGQRSRESDGVG
jgi:hypothetical protein